ncbi:unnamed protein product [Chrysoparadoxa australica]
MQKMASLAATGVGTVEDLSERRKRLLRHREKQRALKAAQKARAQMKASKLRELAAQEAIKAKEEKEWAEMQRRSELAAMGLESADDPRAATKPVAENIHPCFWGYHDVHNDDGWDVHSTHPVYFGAKAETFSHSTQSGLATREALKVVLAMGSPAEQKDAWHIFPVAPVNHGIVRQEMFEPARRYDLGGLIHPSCFGHKYTRESEDSALSSPVMFRYKLLHKQRPVTLGTSGVTRSTFVKYEPGDPCPICLIHRPGCPLCWDFPKGWEPKQFAWEGPQEEIRRAQEAAAAEKLHQLDAKNQEQLGAELVPGDQALHLGGNDNDSQASPKPELHTNLTTDKALRLWRMIKETYVNLFIKGVPCGTVTFLRVGSHYPVHVLYDMFRANSCEGTEQDCVIFLPTVAGVYCLDNQNIAETDISLGVHTGDLPVSRYHIGDLGASKTTLCLLQTHFLSKVKIVENLRHFLHTELPPTTVYQDDVVHHLHGLPVKPQEDPVQQYLVKLMRIRAVQQLQVEEEDRAYDIARRSKALLEAEKARKESVLDRRRAEDSKLIKGTTEWRAHKKQVRNNAHEGWGHMKQSVGVMATWKQAVKLKLPQVPNQRHRRH